MGTREIKAREERISSKVQKSSRLSHWETFWGERQQIDDVYSNADRILRNLLTITDLKGKKILEIGAGSGRDSFPLARAGAKIYQLDYSQNSLSILKHLAEAEQLETTIIGGDTLSLPFHNDSFDIVFHQGLLEHFRKPQAEILLRENIRVLRKGGLLLVDVPQRYHLYTVAKHILIAFNKWFAGWERSFSIGELRSIIRKEGLEVIHSYGGWMYPSFPYRVFRELMKKLGVVLPLYPRTSKVLAHFRERLRLRLLKTPLPLITGISIGVIGMKR